MYQLTSNYDPCLIYVRILYELYSEKVTREHTPTGGIPVTSFRLHGGRALNIIHKHGGVLIANGVGLGKTFTAGKSSGCTASAGSGGWCARRRSATARGGSS